jgi:ATP-dependent HslUV protease ATP-binding subunit HslU
VSRVRFRAEEAAEERILDILLPPARDTETDSSSSTRQLLRKKLREGDLDDKEIEVEISSSSPGMEIMAPPGMEEMTNQLQSMFSNMSRQQSKTQKMPVKAAFEALCDDEAAKMVNEDELKQKAVAAAEQTGIVFLDELDKVAKRAEGAGADVSREGVQRDLLPLIEGSTVTTKHGMIKTDHILFIASGAFHLAKPSDLIPELQGRLPIRVELTALTPEDFERILTEPDASLTEQYQALLATEGLTVEFSKDGLRRIAETAWHVNETTENIGARRLHTVMERLLEETSFSAADTGLQDEPLLVDAAYVDSQLEALSTNEDLSRFIL